MKVFIGLLAVLVSSCSAAMAPNYATCVEVENLTGDTVKAEVLYSNGEVESADVEAGAVQVFDEKEINRGSWTSVNPVLALAVSYDRPHAGPLTVNHDIVVNGVQKCVRRQVKNNLGGFYIE